MTMIRTIIIILAILVNGSFFLYVLLRIFEKTDKMIHVEMNFSETDAIAIFRNAGLEVKMAEMPVYFENPHGDNGHNEMIPMWSVTNPHTGKAEQLKSFFLKYLEERKDKLFLNPGKLEIYNLFERE